MKLEPLVGPLIVIIGGESIAVMLIEITSETVFPPESVDVVVIE